MFDPRNRGLASALIILGTSMACGSEAPRARTDVTAADQLPEGEVLEPHASTVYQPGSEKCSIGFSDRLAPPCRILTELAQPDSAPLCRDFDKIASVQCDFVPELDSAQARTVEVVVVMRPQVQPAQPYEIEFVAGLTHVEDCGNGIDDGLHHACLLPMIADSADAGRLTGRLQIRLEGGSADLTGTLPDKIENLPETAPAAPSTRGGLACVLFGWGCIDTPTTGDGA